MDGADGCTALYIDSTQKWAQTTAEREDFVLHTLAQFCNSFKVFSQGWPSTCSVAEDDPPASLPRS